MDSFLFNWLKLGSDIDGLKSDSKRWICFIKCWW
jgi:hypothetical protein